MHSIEDPGAYRRLIDIGLALSAEREINNLLERILREAKSLSSADAGTLYLTTGRETLRFSIVLNDSLGIHEGGVSSNEVTLPDIPLVSESEIEHIAARSAVSGETVTVHDAYDTDEFDFSGTHEFDALTGYRSTSFLSVPLKTLSGDVLGVLQLINARAEDGSHGPFHPTASPLVESLASLASVALENRYLLDEQEDLKKQLEKEVDNRTEELKDALSKLSEAHIILKELTTTDPVTGIRNRQYFDDVFDQEWRRAARQQYQLSLLVLDIDHFKKVNDTYGHLAGDECLAAVAKQLDSMFNRPSDVVARYGGEEFVCILPYADLEQAAALAEQVREAIANQSFQADGHQLGVTISVGVSTLVPSDGVTQRDLVSLADEALYEAKSSGRNRVCTRVPDTDS